MGYTWDPALTEPGGRTRRLTPQGWFVKPGSVSALTEPGGMVPGEIPVTGRDGPDETPPGSVSAAILQVAGAAQPRWPRSQGEEATVPGPELSPSASPSPNTWRPPNAAGGKP